MHPWFVLFAFLVIGFSIYAPAIKGELVWDDHYLVGENPFFRSPVFAGEVFRHYLFFESFSTYYRPVQNLSYIADYWLWGNSPVGYHCTNVLFHALAAWLLFLLLRRLLPRLMENGRLASVVALVVSSAWLVHPVHNAAVAYISGRADSLAAAFALGAWLLWLKSRELRVPGVATVAATPPSQEGARGASPRLDGTDCLVLPPFGDEASPAHSATGRRRHISAVRTASLRLGVSIASGLLLLVALCSKEIALIWIALFVVHAFFDASTGQRVKIGAISGLAVVLAIYAMLHSLPDSRAAAPGSVAEPFASRVVLMFRALGDYCGLMLAPVRLMMERTLGPGGMYASRQTWWRNIGSEYLSILGVLVLLAAIWLCIRRGEARPLRRFGAAWFAIAFIPISNLIPLNAEVAEHWIYLASIGFLLLLAGAVAMLPERARRWSAMAAVCAIAAFAVRTSFRAADWADAETFARKTIANGGATPRMLAYLAQELGRQGRLGEQEQVYRKALALYPDYTTARINLGLSLQKQGRLDEARKLLDIGRAGAVVATVPRTWNAALNLAGQMHKEGRSTEALALLREWRPRHPDTWELPAYEASILRETQGPRAALSVVDEYARAHWWHFSSQIGLASLQRECGDFSAALATARRAQRLDIRGAAAFDEAARIEMALGRPADALESVAEAVARDPRNPDYLDLFSAVLRQLGRQSEALAVRRKAETLAAATGRKLL